MTTISKIKNFEGYWFTCSCCGAEIRHGYRINGSKEIYGSSCVLKTAYNKKFMRQKISAADRRYATVQHYHATGRIEKIAAQWEMSVDQYIESYTAGAIG